LAIPDQIKQVFLNLLNNAADACRQNGGVITISTWQEEQNVAIAIEDTGTGIPSEIMGMIFQPFFTTKDAVKGTGLGLSVCHGIVQNHQGEIRVESKEGEGSTFIVILPIGDSISMKQLPGNNFR
jgi:signal transduction histidine kinase